MKIREKELCAAIEIDGPIVVRRPAGNARGSDTGLGKGRAIVPLSLGLTYRHIPQSGEFLCYLQCQSHSLNIRDTTALVYGKMVA